MYEIGQTVKGKFLRTTTHRDRAPDPLLQHISGALFEVDNGQWVKLPVSHALEQYSDGMTRRRLVRMAAGQELDFEIIGVDVKPNRTFITVSEKVAAARILVNQPKKLWTVTVVLPHRFVGKGLQVQFPSGFKTYAHQAWLGLGDRMANVSAGASLIVKLNYISPEDGKWFLHMAVADPKHYPDHEVVGSLPAMFLAAASLAETSPDLAADFVRHVTTGGAEAGE